MHVERLVSPIRLRRERRAVRAARAAADAELLRARLPSPRLAWRTAELTDPERRLELARQLTDTVHASDGARLPGASPLDRAVVRSVQAQLLALASRVADLDRPALPRGILLVERLLHEGSPLYDATAADPRTEVERALAELDGPR